MKNTKENAGRFIFQHLPNWFRPTIDELEDLLVRYAAAVDTPTQKQAPRRVDPSRDPEDVIGDAIR
jgi:hypothetical protein